MDNKLSLENVVLSTVVGHPKGLEQSLKAILYSAKNINFRNIQVLSCVPFNFPGIKCINIPQMTSQGYNDFMIKSYSDYIDAEYVLHIQEDGFVINPEAWTNQFLEYDYIGALWPWFNDDKRCGNGGFTFRSKKILDICKKYCPPPSSAEDVCICRENRDIFIKNEIKFASYDIAVKFSIELPVPEAAGQDTMVLGSVKSFGFHKPGSPLLNLKNNIDLSNLTV